MITRFKIFETVSTQPNLGDYVILMALPGSDFYKFVNFNVGKIIKIAREHGGRGYNFTVEYENIPKILSFHEQNYFYTDNTRKCTTQEFKYWSDNKEELETLINAEKYNL
jgi:hypothetical protein